MATSLMPSDLLRRALSGGASSAKPQDYPGGAWPTPSEAETRALYEPPQSSRRDMLVQALALLPIIGELGRLPKDRDWRGALTSGLHTWAGLRGMQEDRRQGEMTRRERLANALAGGAKEAWQSQQAAQEAAWNQESRGFERGQRGETVRQQARGRELEEPVAEVQAGRALETQRRQTALTTAQRQLEDIGKEPAPRAPTPVRPADAYGTALARAIDDIEQFAGQAMREVGGSIKPAYYPQVIKQMNVYLSQYGLPEVTEEQQRVLMSPAPQVADEGGASFWNRLKRAVGLSDDVPAPARSSPDNGQGWYDPFGLETQE